LFDQRQHRRLNRHDGFALFFEHVPRRGTTCAAATGYENIRDYCAYIRHLPNKRFAQSNSNGSRASTSDKRRAVVTT
jgi:hypothetical protein